MTGFWSSALLVLATGLAPAAAQTTYYVASSGSDANSGRSADAPFQTIAKVNSLTLRAGDAVLFRRGDTFRGTLQIRQSGTAGSPIVLDAYGSGNKPVLSGSVPVSNWTNIGNNTWQASCASCGSRVTGLYRNGSALPLGRYPNADAPNKGYLTVQAHSGRTQLTSQQGLSTNWTGGEAVIRPLQWILDRATITQQNGNTLTLNNPNNQDIADGWGFFIQNHPAALDQTGEWSYNAATKTLSLYDNQTNPNGQTITATVSGEGINLTNAGYVTVRNLKITETLTTGVLVNSGNNLTFSSLDVTNSGEDGVLITGSGSNVVMENSLIEEANNNGFTIQPYPGSAFRGNTIRRVGLWPGRGRSNDGSYIGLNSLNSAGMTIENNVVDNVGYNGISFVNRTTIRRNQVANFCLVKSDGGGIYIWNRNKLPLEGITIASNIVYNGIGAPEGTPGGAYAGANGIFLDECVSGVTIADNTVFNCHGLGIFLHASLNTSVTGNTVFNNGEGQLEIAHNHGVCPPRGNVIRNNVLVSRLAGQYTAKYISNANDLSSYGDFDNNVYARPFDDQFNILAAQNTGSGIVGANLSLAEWQSRYGKDINSRKSPLTFKTYKITGTGAEKLNHSFTGSTDGWESWSPHGNGRIAWDNGNRLDGGSLRVSFASASNQANSYVLASSNIGAVSAGKTYQLTFDAVASGPNKRVEVFLRQRAGSYRDLDARTGVVVGTSRQRVETVFTASMDESSALVVMQVAEDGQTIWFDNVQLREVTRSTVNPDDYIRLVYNATPNNTQVALDGNYRDMQNVLRQGQLTLAPFTSLVLLKEENTAPAPPPAPPVSPGTGTGLKAEYFNNRTLTAPATLTRTDATVNFDWGVNAPAGGIGVDNFSVRWSGQVEAPVSGSYVFSTTSDDGVRLWVNGVQVINNWTDHAPTTDNGAAITLTAGQKYDIRMEYYESAVGAVARLLWAYPGQDQQVIPQSRLYPAPVSGSGTGTVTYLSDLNWTNVTNGYGPVEKDRSNGEAGATDGRTITLNGVTYAKGLGVHAPSEITYSLGGRYATFLSDIGIDDEISGCGTVVFEVYLDNVLAYSSGVMTAESATKTINLNVAGKQTLKLVATIAGDNANCDHADWAGARLIGTSGARLAVVPEFDADALVRVYPIPARDELQVRYQAAAPGPVVVQLLNVAAQPALHLTQSAEAGENLIRLPVRALPRGVYVLSLYQNGRRTTRRVLLTE